MTVLLSVTSLSSHLLPSPVWRSCLNKLPWFALNALVNNSYHLLWEYTYSKHFYQLRHSTNASLTHHTIRFHAQYDLHPPTIVTLDLTVINPIPGIIPRAMMANLKDLSGSTYEFTMTTHHNPRVIVHLGRIPTRRTKDSTRNKVPKISSRLLQDVQIPWINGPTTKTYHSSTM